MLQVGTHVAQTGAGAGAGAGHVVQTGGGQQVLHLRPPNAIAEVLLNTTTPAASTNIFTNLDISILH